ncbi:MocR-like pyridoxine biosynthesis transcription factor PdxR [Microlunatus soli]|uniref:MocR-like pyridoxine biosynthesis transcription factor PdxR n=1 Tax=Microlunatus soli TaxID=630515 RepID=UPI000B81D641|nr:PLP-dependent aminotransferase family protein [Microlunatus soli]
MRFHVRLDVADGHAASIYRELLDAVLDGRLRPGERLPSSRELASTLGVARGTVSTAYDRLAAEGFLTSRAGSGTFVGADARPDRSRHAPRGRGADPRPIWNRLPAAVSEAPALPYDLSVGGPDTNLFPLPVWRRMVSATLRTGLINSAVYDTAPHPLRGEIARYLGQSRSVQAADDDVLLTNGAQQGLDLCARVLLAAGDRVAVEDPGYNAAARLFASHGAKVIGVPVDDEGLIVDRLPTGTKIIYVTPSHQFPTGAVMSLRRRIALLDWAAVHNAVILEDDYDSEFRYADRPLEPLQSLDADGRVVYLGSFSKILHPMLRVGYLVAPSSLQAALGEAKRLTDWQGDAVTQGALARFLGEGQLSTHLRRSLKIYRERRTTLLAELDRLHEVTVLPSAAGLHVCLRLPPGSEDRTVAARAADLGVTVEPISPRFVGADRWPGLALGFRNIGVDRIPAAIALLRRTLR